VRRYGRLLAATALLPLAPAGAQSLSANQSATDAPMVVPAGYRLVWSDEFDKGKAPDPAKWAYDTSRNREGWYNNELQYYAANRAENVRVEDGALLI